MEVKELGLLQTTPHVLLYVCLLRRNNKDECSFKRSHLSCSEQSSLLPSPELPLHLLLAFPHTSIVQAQRATVLASIQPCLGLTHKLRGQA